MEQNMNRKPIIAIDMDEVISETNLEVFNLLMKAGHKLTEDLRESDGVRFWECFNSEPEELDSIFDVFHTKESLLNLNTIENATVSINELIKNNEIWIISARPTNVIDVSADWLDLKSIRYDRLIHTGTPKGKYSYTKDVDCIIEDTFETAIHFANEGSSAILLKRSHNKEWVANLPNLHFANNWEEIMKVIPKIL